MITFEILFSRLSPGSADRGHSFLLKKGNWQKSRREEASSADRTFSFSSVFS